MLVGLGLAFMANAAKLPDSVAMVVAGKPVSLPEFVFMAKKNGNVDFSDKKALNEYVELYKNFKLKVHEAEEEGLDRGRDFREELEKNADPTYREFHRSLVPGLDNFLGIRVPKLREISRKAAREDYWSFTREADRKIYEELMIRGMMIGYARLSKEEQRRELEEFVPCIDNWAVCDCCCSTYKFMKKNQEEWFAFLKTYAASGKEYEIRFVLVAMLDYFINEEYIDRVLEILGQVRHEGYYVKMAAAWAVSICYVKFPEKTEGFLKKDLLDDFTHNKSIQKIRESYRVSKEDKERLKTLRRNPD